MSKRTSTQTTVPPAPRSARLLRVAWVAVGLLCVAIGAVGIVVPGLPTTVFFIAAAACFTRSSPRLERWVLGLPGIGQAIRDHRSGLGMPRRAKVAAVLSIAGFSILGALVLDSGPGRAVLGIAAVVGVLVVLFRVPTRERVLAGAGAAEAAHEPG